MLALFISKVDVCEVLFKHALCLLKLRLNARRISVSCWGSKLVHTLHLLAALAERVQLLSKVVEEGHDAGLDCIQVIDS